MSEHTSHREPEHGGGVEAVQAVLLWVVVAAGLAYGVYQTVIATTALFTG